MPSTTPPSLSFRHLVEPASIRARRLARQFVARNRGDRVSGIIRLPLEATGQRVYSELLASPPGTRRDWIFHKLRQLLVRMGDPQVTFEVAGSPLRMPLSHQLPLYLVRYPLYSRNFARLALASAGKYADLAVVDIGANIGDSVALARGASVTSFLCVEADPTFLSFLRQNVREMTDDVSIAPVLLADVTGDLRADLVTAHGTGRVTLRSGSLPVPALSLDDLLVRFPTKGKIKLLKSDTDGFEAHILQGGIESLRRHRPVIFFEYDPDMLAANGRDGLSLLHTLVQEAGYSRALLYDNLGDLLLSVRLDNTDVLTEIHGYFVGHSAQRYLDIAAFHDEDTDLFESFREQEHLFYGIA